MSSGLPYWFVVYMMIIAPIMIGCTVAYCQDRAFRRKVTGFLVLAGMVSLIRMQEQLKRARNWAHGVQSEKVPPKNKRLTGPKGEKGPLSAKIAKAKGAKEHGKAVLGSKLGKGAKGSKLYGKGKKRSFYLRAN